MIEGILDEVRKYNRTEVAYKTGLSISTLNNILGGRNTNPTLETVEKLQNFIKEKQDELASKSK